MAGALANRYARALVEVATKPGASVSPEQIIDELRSFIGVLNASAELRNVLLSPAVTPDKKKALLDALGQRLVISATTRNFLRVVMDHRRLAYLEQMLSGFQTLLDEQMGIVRAEVTAAQPVESGQQAAMAARLGELTGKKVRLDFSVDARLLGGVVARIDSTIYDGSVRGQLRAIERRLATD